jgi:hypothetical protein
MKLFYFLLGFAVFASGRDVEPPTSAEKGIELREWVAWGKMPREVNLLLWQDSVWVRFEDTKLGGIRDDRQLYTFIMKNKTVLQSIRDCKEAMSIMDGGSLSINVGNENLVCANCFICKETFPNALKKWNEYAEVYHRYANFLVEKYARVIDSLGILSESTNIEAMTEKWKQEKNPAYRRSDSAYISVSVQVLQENIAEFNQKYKTEAFQNIGQR